MLQFFRKIRRGLLKENKFSKYLLYAIGEIILVVIGILIALQINNWNTSRLKKQDEIKYYQNIRRQIYDDLKEVAEARALNNVHTKQFEYANQLITAKDHSKTDQLALITMGLSQYSDFHRSGNIYETLVNSGDLKLFKNSDLPNWLQKLETTYTYINKLEDIHWEIIMTEFSPEIRGVFNYSTFEIIQPEKLFSVEIQNIFVECIYLTRGKDSIYSRAIGEMTSTIELINRELETSQLFEEIGIAGSAVESGWDKSIPMTLINIEKGIWQAELKLNKGELKFRSFDSWIQNWGGNSFPAGQLELSGSNIVVEPGTYLITLNFAKSRYSFEKVVD